VQHQQRQNSIECRIRERQAACITNAKGDPGICIATGGVLDVRRRIVDPADRFRATMLGQQKGQAAGTAADIQHPLAV
jgi:hypothetical protein